MQVEVELMYYTHQAKPVAAADSSGYECSICGTGVEYYPGLMLRHVDEQISRQVFPAAADAPMFDRARRVIENALAGVYEAGATDADRAVRAAECLYESGLLQRRRPSRARRAPAGRAA